MGAVRGQWGEVTGVLLFMGTELQSGKMGRF